MDTNYLENNYLTLVGKVTGEKEFSHEIYGERFYIFNLAIPRLSGNEDIIPITISERLIKEDTLQTGKKLLVKGQFRSYNSYENEKNRLILTVFAKDIMEVEEKEEEENEMVRKDTITNEVVLIGYLCKKPIAWGRNARFCQNLEVGSQVKVVGRVQSRTYEKKFEDGTSQTRVAYEVSIGSLEVIEEKTTEKEEDEENQEAV